MPFLWTPHAPLLLAPLALLTFLSTRFAYFTWLCGLFFVLVRAVSVQRATSSILFTTIAILTPVSTLGIVLGQPSLTVAALLIWLATTPVLRGRWVLPATLFVGLKAPYLCPLAIILINRNERKALIQSFGGLALAILLSCALSGSNLIESFLRALILFGKQKIDDPFPFDSSGMANFTAALSPVFSWEALQPVSVGLFLVLQGVALVVALRGHRSPIAPVLSLAGILLFSPYLGAYEEILLLAVLLPCAPYLSHRALSSLGVVALLILLRPATLSDMGQLGIFVAKGCFFVGLIDYLRHRPPLPESELS